MKQSPIRCWGREVAPFWTTVGSASKGLPEEHCNNPSAVKNQSGIAKGAETLPTAATELSHLPDRWHKMKKHITHTASEIPNPPGNHGSPVEQAADRLTSPRESSTGVSRGFSFRVPWNTPACYSDAGNEEPTLPWLPGPSQPRTDLPGSRVLPASPVPPAHPFLAVQKVQSKPILPNQHEKLHLPKWLLRASL